eukprot:m.128994 g.128994  ORF g.128994 m.128994 type:complete len:885 (-) comp15687_c0_seq1:393-3047(-)
MADFAQLYDDCVGEDGGFGVTELRKVLNSVGSATDASDETLKSLLTQLDVDEDGIVSKTDFCSAMAARMPSTRHLSIDSDDFWEENRSPDGCCSAFDIDDQEGPQTWPPLVTIFSTLQEDYVVSKSLLRQLCDGIISYADQHAVEAREEQMTTRSQYERLVEVHNQVSEDNHRLESELQDLTAQRRRDAELSAENKILHAKIEELEIELQRRVQQASDMSVKADIHLHDKMVLEKERNQLQTECEALRTELKVLDADREVRTVTTEQLMKERDTALLTVKDFRNELEKTVQRLQLLEDEVTHKTEALQHSEAQVRLLEETLLMRDTTIDNLKSEVDEVKQLLSSLEENENSTRTGSVLNEIEDLVMTQLREENGDVEANNRMTVALLQRLLPRIEETRLDRVPTTLPADEYDSDMEVYDAYEGQQEEIEASEEEVEELQEEEASQAQGVIQAEEAAPALQEEKENANLNLLSSYGEQAVSRFSPQADHDNRGVPNGAHTVKASVTKSHTPVPLYQQHHGLLLETKQGDSELNSSSAAQEVLKANRSAVDLTSSSNAAKATHAQPSSPSPASPLSSSGSSTLFRRPTTIASSTTSSKVTDSLREYMGITPEKDALERGASIPSVEGVQVCEEGQASTAGRKSPTGSQHSQAMVQIDRQGSEEPLENNGRRRKRLTPTTLLAKAHAPAAIEMLLASAESEQMDNQLPSPMRSPRPAESVAPLDRAAEQKLSHVFRLYAASTQHLAGVKIVTRESAEAMSKEELESTAKVLKDLISARNKLLLKTLGEREQLRNEINLKRNVLKPVLDIALAAQVPSRPSTPRTPATPRTPRTPRAAPGCVTPPADTSPPSVSATTPSPPAPRRRSIMDSFRFWTSPGKREGTELPV